MTLEPLPYYKWMWRDWRSNRRVQRMHYIARGFYRELLDEQWCEGSIPDDDKILADICGCPLAVFQQYWTDISPCFEHRPDGRLVNAKLESQRTELDEKRVKLSDSGRLGAISRAARVSEVQQMLIPAEQMPYSKSRAEQSLNTYLSGEDTPKVTERKSKTVDPRHAPFREEFLFYWKSQNNQVEPPWDGSEARNLSAFLSANPRLTIEGYKKLLLNRARSDVNHSERGRVVIPRLTDYTNGSLDMYGKPKMSGGGQKHNEQQQRIAKNRQGLNAFVNPGRAEASSGSQLPVRIVPALESTTGRR